jgi:hypothetical protein
VEGQHGFALIVVTHQLAEVARLELMPLLVDEIRNQTA